MLKKLTSIILITLLTVCMLTACTDTNSTKNGKLTVVCTVFPQYDWVRNILGEKLEQTQLELLLDSGTDLHSYQPTAADIIKITSSDLFIYIGGESESWVNDIIHSTSCSAKTLKLMDILGDGAYEEELAEGMEAPEEATVSDCDMPEYDEHIWLSLKNASKLCAAIKDALCEVDPSNAEIYEKNCGKYRQDLAVLDGEYTETVQNASRKVLLFADRFPFRYMTEDYGLEYYAAFSGCSTETEASFETLTFLAKKTDECDLPVILITETSDGSVAKTILATAKPKDRQILVMDAMQSVTADKLTSGITYIDTMRSNLAVLQNALN